jgi:hypothetical protein
LPAVIAKPADARRARAIAARSSQLRSLLARAPYRLAAAGVWPGLGVNLTYRLKRPIDVNDVLPYAEVPPDAPSSGDCHAPYVSGWERLQASDVTRISARVDLKSGRLAEIWTNAVRGTVSPVPGRAFPQCEEK